MLARGQRRDLSIPLELQRAAQRLTDALTATPVHYSSSAAAAAQPLAKLGRCIPQHWKLPQAPYG